MCGLEPIKSNLLLAAFNPVHEGFVSELTAEPHLQLVPGQISLFRGAESTEPDDGKIAVRS